MDQIITKSPHCSWLRGHWVTKKEFLLTISIHYLAGCSDKNEHNFFSQFVSGRYSTHPAIWLVPRAGSILPIRTAHSGSGSFRSHLLGFRKNKNVIHQPRSVRIGKNCALCLVCLVLGIQDLGHSFSQYGPPVRWITNMYEGGDIDWFNIKFSELES